MSQARPACGSSLPQAQSTASCARRLAWAAALVAGGLTAAAQAEGAGSALAGSSVATGLSHHASPLSSMWQRQADTVHHFHLGRARFDLSLAHADLHHQRGRLFGDYYLTGPGFAEGHVDGGLRLTSGLAFGRVLTGLASSVTNGPDWPALGGDSQAVAQPYLGLGYSRLATRAGWGFSADIGLGRWAAPDSPRLGQGGPSDSQINRLLDDLRLSPVIQLGVRYAF